MLIGSKTYLTDAPLDLFPSSTRLAGVAALNTYANDSATSVSLFGGTQIEYAVLSGKPYSLVPLVIPANQNFNVVMAWNTPVAMPSGLNGRIGVRLNGWLYRLSQ